MKHILALLVALMALGGICAAEDVPDEIADVEANADVSSVVELTLAGSAEIGDIYPDGGEGDSAGTVTATENWEITWPEDDVFLMDGEEHTLDSPLGISVSPDEGTPVGTPVVDGAVTATFTQAFTSGDYAGDDYSATITFTINVVS